MQEYSQVEKTMYIRLSNPYWFAGPLPRWWKVAPGTEGAVNICWALAGKPRLQDLKFGNTKAWVIAETVSKIHIEGAQLECTATVLTLEQFAAYVKRIGNIRVLGIGVLDSKALLKGLGANV